MKQIVLVVGLCGSLLGLPALADVPKPVKVSVILSGVVNDQCVEPLRQALARVPGIKASTEGLTPGTRPNFFSEPFVIEIADPDKTDLGTIAKTVAEAKTPVREDLPPRLNLVFFSSEQEVKEGEVVALREAMGEVSGVDARAPGGTGGRPGRGMYWVRLDGSGQATLADIQAALKKGNLGLRLERP